MTHTKQDSDLEPLYDILGYRFRNARLLRTALTHPSLEGAEHYQRLEFIGDRVLGLVVAEMLYTGFPNIKEGGLAVRLAALVRKEALADVALGLKIGPYIRMAGGTEDMGGRTKPAILADVCEAMIGALYLDGGLSPAARFVSKNWADLLADKTTSRKDAKSALQEWVQGRGQPAPVYRQAGRSGPDHQPVFTIEVEVEGRAPVTGEGASKRMAEQAAAECMLRHLQKKV